jgi:hypothetical protein
MGSVAGPDRVPPGVSTPGEDAQIDENSGDLLEWQGELDVAIAEIDSRLAHPRRRATDAEPAHTQPQLTPEMIDEIAWRVADLLKRDGTSQAPGTTVAAAISKTVAAAPTPEPRRLPEGTAVTIRVRRPFFRLPWPFRRRKRQAMIMFSDYRVS